MIGQHPYRSDQFSECLIKASEPERTVKTANLTFALLDTEMEYDCVGVFYLQLSPAMECDVAEGDDRIACFRGRAAVEYNCSGFSVEEPSKACMLRVRDCC